MKKLFVFLILIPTLISSLGWSQSSLITVYRGVQLPPGSNLSGVYVRSDGLGQMVSTNPADAIAYGMSPSGPVGGNPVVNPENNVVLTSFQVSPDQIAFNPYEGSTLPGETQHLFLNPDVDITQLPGFKQISVPLSELQNPDVQASALNALTGTGTPLAATLGENPFVEVPTEPAAAEDLAGAAGGVFGLGALLISNPTGLNANETQIGPNGQYIVPPPQAPSNLGLGSTLLGLAVNTITNPLATGLNLALDPSWTINAANNDGANLLALLSMPPPGYNPIDGTTTVYSSGGYVTWNPATGQGTGVDFSSGTAIPITATANPDGTNTFTYPNGTTVVANSADPQFNGASTGPGSLIFTDDNPQFANAPVFNNNNTVTVTLADGSSQTLPVMSYADGSLYVSLNGTQVSISPSSSNAQQVPYAAPVAGITESPAQAAPGTVAATDTGGAGNVNQTSTNGSFSGTGTTVAANNTSSTSSASSDPFSYTTTSDAPSNPFSYPTTASASSGSASAASAPAAGSSGGTCTNFVLGVCVDSLAGTGLGGYTATSFTPTPSGDGDSSGNSGSSGTPSTGGSDDSGNTGSSPTVFVSDSSQCDQTASCAISVTPVDYSGGTDTTTFGDSTFVDDTPAPDPTSPSIADAPVIDISAPAPDIDTSSPDYLDALGDYDGDYDVDISQFYNPGYELEQGDVESDSWDVSWF